MSGMPSTCASAPADWSPESSDSSSGSAASGFLSGCRSSGRSSSGISPTSGVSLDCSFDDSLMPGSYPLRRRLMPGQGSGPDPEVEATALIHPISVRTGSGPSDQVVEWSGPGPVVVSPDPTTVVAGHIFGIITWSMRYTVALAVCTPPQITLAPLTLRLSPEPVTLTVPPWTVLRVWPAIWSGSICSGTTW